VWRHFASIVKSITLFSESGEKKSQIELENEIVLRFPESNEKSTKSSTVGVNFTNILVKLTAIVNYTNILQVAFSHESIFKVFLWLQFCFVIFCQNNIVTKAGHKMSMKLTAGSTQECVFWDFETSGA